MAAQNFKEEDWGNGDTKLGQNWHKNSKRVYFHEVERSL